MTSLLVKIGFKVYMESPMKYPLHHPPLNVLLCIYSYTRSSLKDRMLEWYLILSDIS